MKGNKGNEGRQRAGRDCKGKGWVPDQSDRGLWETLGAHGSEDHRERSQHGPELRWISQVTVREQVNLICLLLFRYPLVVCASDMHKKCVVGASDMHQDMGQKM